jgi:type I restriction enzyme S subunit
MESPWAIPVVWAWTEIKSIGAVVSGGTPSTKVPSYWGDEINWISPADLTKYTNKTISKGAKSITRKGLKNSSAKLMPAGSVHFSSRAPIGYIAISSETLCTNQGFKSLVPAKGIFNEYLYYYLKAAKHLAEERATGTTFREISGTAFGKLPFPLAPCNEQHRIVAKIEELFSELDKGAESLKTAREQLKVYRQAVLKHAFEGKLTAQWREENKDDVQGSTSAASAGRAGAAKLESTDQLLARIQKERETRCQQQLEAWKDAVKAWEKNGKDGKKPSKPTKSKLNDGAQTRNGAFPAEWSALELGFLAAESVLGKMLDKAKNSGSHKPYLGNINVRWGNFDLENLKTIKIEDTEVARYCLTPGDLVICEGGEPGRCAVWKKKGKQMFIQKALHRIRFTDSYNPYFAYYFLVYISLTQRIAKYFTGTTIQHLTGTGLAKIPFPVCPIEEQALVVSIVEQQFSAVDALDEQITDELTRAETLRQSILKKAFSGQLVEQDPNDEPASVLLERINAEKARQTPRKKTAKRKAETA